MLLQLRAACEGELLFSPIFLSFDCGHAVMGDGVPAIRFLIKIVEIVLTYQDIYVNILLRSGTTAVVFMMFFHSGYGRAVMGSTPVIYYCVVYQVML